MIASIRRLRIGTDIGLALGVVFILSMLILPLPPFLLDVGLSLSFTSGVLVLMVALFVVKPLDFTSFPTILLLTTLLRLALDVAATRQILAHGNEGMLAAGHVIAAFGGFLMGGDIVIGLIVFAILLVVNFSLWVEQDQKANFLAKGCTVVDPASVLTTHLTELVKESMADLLSYAETQKLLDDLPREQQKLLSDMVPGQISVGGIQRVLQALLGERISIRDLPTILESIQEACANQAKTIPAIAAHVRTKLARQISDSLMGANGYLPLIVLSNEWETEFSEALVGPPEARQLALSPARMQDFMRRFGQAYEEAAASGDTPALLTSTAIRQHVRAVIERVRPSVPVLAQTEIFARARIRTLSTI